MVKECCTCYHKSKSLIDKPCNSCSIGYETIAKETGITFPYCPKSIRESIRWEPEHTCSTCKHWDKKITEEPCLDCDIRMRYDKWEARE